MGVLKIIAVAKDINAMMAANVAIMAFEAKYLLKRWPIGHHQLCIEPKLASTWS